MPNLLLGGQQRVAIKTADILKNDYNVTLVIFDRRDAIYKPHCDFINLNEPASPNCFNKIIRAISRVRKIKRIRVKKVLIFHYLLEQLRIYPTFCQEVLEIQ